jgi:hypothetical protein
MSSTNIREDSPKHLGTDGAELVGGMHCPGINFRFFSEFWGGFKPEKLDIKVLISKMQL